MSALLDWLGLKGFQKHQAPPRISYYFICYSSSGGIQEYDRQKEGKPGFAGLSNLHFCEMG